MHISPTLFFVIFTTALAVVIALSLRLHFLLWLQGYFSNADIAFPNLILMSIRGVDPRIIVRSKIMLRQAGFAPVPTKAMETHVLSGGDLNSVTLALISAQRAGILLDWCTAADVDLAGRDILAAVRGHVNPQVIYCPASTIREQQMISAVSRDGIELKIRVAVTVRTNLPRLVGGATEKTIIARVGHGIIAAIGSCQCYQQALQDPLSIASSLALHTLDSETCFSIVSVNIHSIDIGENIGAKLRIAQADARASTARAAAAGKFSIAIAEQREMAALTLRFMAVLMDETRAETVAIASAYRVGQLHSNFHRKIPRIRSLANEERVELQRQIEAWESDGGSCSNSGMAIDRRIQLENASAETN